MRLLRLTAGLLLLSAGGIACTQGADGTPVPVVHASNAAVTPLLPTNVLALPSFDPGTFQELLGQLRGTPVVVNVWASWCKPCEDETPLLVKAAKTYAGRVQFLGIDIQDARTSARTFQQRYRVPYPSVYDPTSAVQHSLGFYGQPETVFYDAGGRAVDTVPLPLDEETLKTGLDKALGG